jgi:hypothetical protein
MSSAPAPIQESWRMDQQGRLVSPIWIQWFQNLSGSSGSGTSTVATSHSQLTDVLQADDTSSSTEGGKHVTDEMVLKYESHRTTTGNPHNTEWSQISGTVVDIPFSPVPTGSRGHAEGLLFYDSDDHSLCYYNEATGVTVNLGRESLIRVYNNTGSTLTDGQAVYINGAYSSWPTVALAKADTSIDSQSVIGMVTNAFANGTYGYICTSGVVHDLNTSAYSAGDILYLSESTAGGMTKVEPIQPNYSVELGVVLVSNAVAGQVFVHVDKKLWFPNLQVIDTTASQVLPTTPTIFKAPTTVVAQGLAYDASTGETTINTSGDYGVSILLNAQPNSSNKNIYFYVEEYYGGTWTIGQYTARLLRLPNSVETQLTISANRYWRKGSKIRFYVWGDANVSLITANLPGTTPGTVTIPAYRFMMA